MQGGNDDHRGFIRSYVERAVRYQKPLGIPVATFQILASPREIARALGSESTPDLADSPVAGFVKAFCPAVRDVAGGGEFAGEIGGRKALEPMIASDPTATVPETVHFDVSHLLKIVDDTPDYALKGLLATFEGAVDVSVARFSSRVAGQRVDLPRGDHQESFRFDRRFFQLAGCEEPGRFAPLALDRRKRIEGYVRLFPDRPGGPRSFVIDALRAAQLYSQSLWGVQKLLLPASKEGDSLANAIAGRTELYSYAYEAMRSSTSIAAYAIARGFPQGVPDRDVIAKDLRLLGHHLAAYEEFMGARLASERDALGVIRFPAGLDHPGAHVRIAGGDVMLVSSAGEERLAEKLTEEGRALGRAVSRLHEQREAIQVHQAQPGFWKSLGLTDPTAGLEGMTRRQLQQLALDTLRGEEGGKAVFVASTDEQFFAWSKDRSAFRLGIESSAAVALTLRLASKSPPRGVSEPFKDGQRLVVSSETLKPVFGSKSVLSDEHYAFLVAAMRESLSVSRERERFMEARERGKAGGRGEGRGA